MSEVLMEMWLTNFMLSWVLKNNVLHYIIQKVIAKLEEAYISSKLW